MSDTKFRLKKVTAFSELASIGCDPTQEHLLIPSSDITFTTDSHIFQFEMIREGDKQKGMEVKPGIYRIGYQGNTLSFIPTELKKQNLLESITNTNKIRAEADRFFQKLHIYDLLGEQKARKVLLYSDPGVGKTATISKYATEMVSNDPGASVMIWPTAEIDSDTVLNLLSDAEYIGVTSLLLIMEDIGGNEREGHGGPRGVDSDLLEILDGARNIYKVPTFVIATTNYPQNLLSALADRPGRFDLLLKLDYPSATERVQLAEFFIKRELTPSEREVFLSNRTGSFSIAHIKEAVIRHMLSDLSIEDTVQQLIDHKKRYEKSFEEDSGFGFNR